MGFGMHVVGSVRAASSLEAAGEAATDRAAAPFLLIGIEGQVVEPCKHNSRAVKLQLVSASS
jgi:hypothetical protein